MLDTNTFSYIVRGTSGEARRTLKARLADAALCVSALTEAEILFGLAKAPKAMRIRKLSEEVFALLIVLPWDSAASRAYALLKLSVSGKGKTLDTFDLLIAAHAVSVDAILVTHDRAFANAGSPLQLEDWATDLPS